MKEFKKVCGLVGRDQRDGLDAVSLAKLYRRGGELARDYERMVLYRAHMRTLAMVGFGAQTHESREGLQNAAMSLFLQLSQRGHPAQRVETADGVTGPDE